jgi:hypothetical protein
MTVKSLTLFVLFSVACTGVSEKGPARDHAEMSELVGVWDATMSLAQPYPLEPDPPAAREVCGTLGFVENRGRVYGGTDSDTPLQIGVYDLALKRIGLEWNAPPAFPAAVASRTLGDDSVRRLGVGDSLRIVLNPGSDERIILLGRYEGREIKGDWTAQSARGTAGGAFSMRPHAIGREAPGRCSTQNPGSSAR